MDVLAFECNDYRISVSTADIDYAWERFQRRVKEDSATYCDYSSSRSGTLFLRNQIDRVRKLEPQNEPVVPRSSWLNLWPVLFETCEYQFAVELKNLADTAALKCRPRIRHKLKSIVDSFKFFSTAAHSGILVGNINFLNSPGKFTFGFEYTDGGGIQRTERLEFFVASPKLDTKNDLRRITALINQEYENYVFDYLTLTFSSFVLQRSEQNNGIIWLSIFRKVVQDYFHNVRFILSQPHNKPLRRAYYDRPDRIRRWSRMEVERFVNLGADAEHCYFRHEQTERTINTQENRFVKYTLRVLEKKFQEILGELSPFYADMDDSEKETLNLIAKTFKTLLSDRFFRKVGEFEGLRQESAVLQQRSGYSNVYKTWLVLKNGLDLVDGKTDIGLKKIWELYEIWCYLVMKRLIARVLRIELNDKERMKEDKSQMINTMLKSNMLHVITFYPDTGDVVRLEYQHTYNRRSKEFNTATTEQRPDIVLTITKPNGFVLTYLYDAKYRVQDDTCQGELDAGESIDHADYPLPDAINQMHRYRDAIYYAMEQSLRPQGKEVIGGYILFPGRAEGGKVEQRYFYQSIRKVNIGAFPLLPATEGEEHELVQSPLLENHLREILLENSIVEHIKDSIPQKGLFYHLAPEGDNQLVLVAYCKEGQLNLVKKNKLYYMRAGNATGSLRLVPGYEYCRYLLLYRGKECSLFRLSDKGMRIFPRKDLEQLGFSPSYDFYYVVDIEDNNPLYESSDFKSEGKLCLREQKNVYLKEPYFAKWEELFV